MEYTYYRCRCCGQQNSLSEKVCTRCQAKLAMYGDVITENQGEPPVIVDSPEPIKEKKKRKREKKRNLKIIPIILAVFIFVFMCFVFIGLSSANGEDYELLKSKYDTLDLKYDELSSKYDEMKDQYKFYDEFARIIPDDDSKIYHRYGCSERSRDVGFIIYNVGNAKNAAEPCTVCCSDD